MAVPVAGDVVGVSPSLGFTLSTSLLKPSAKTVKLPLYADGSAPSTVTISPIDNP